jgi:predicted nucleic acid-binding protein
LNSANYNLDSSVWIEYLDGTKKGEKIRELIENEAHSTSILAIAEIADRYARTNQPFKEALHFIQSKTTLLPLTVNISLKAAQLKKQIRQNIPKIGLVDALHLATALESNATFITSDTDFRGQEKVIIL